MGALDGLKILDFSESLPGPYATLVLADLGAQVIHVSAPGRYDMLVQRPPMIEGTDMTGCGAWIGRNKRQISLDLKVPESVEAVKKLIMEYDIVVEGFRPGVMKRFGLDYDTLKEVNPKVIYCSITGYGQTGPKAMSPGHDMNYMSLAGILAPAGQEHKPPVISNTYLGDLVGGSMSAIIAILAAYIYRENTGEGQYLDIGMMDGVVPLNSWLCAAYLSTDLSGDQDDGSNGRELYGTYETADHRYMCVGAIEPKFVVQVLDCLGLSEWAEDQRWIKEPKEARARLQEVFRTKTWEEWTEFFADKEVCVDPVLSTREMCYEPQILERGMILDVPLPLEPDIKVRQMGNPIKMSVTPPQYRHAGYPDGYHTEEVLEGLGYTPEQIKEMAKL